MQRIFCTLLHVGNKGEKEGKFGALFLPGVHAKQLAQGRIISKYFVDKIFRGDIWDRSFGGLFKQYPTVAGIRYVMADAIMVDI